MMLSKLMTKGEAKKLASSYTKRMQKAGKPYYFGKAVKSNGGYRVQFKGRRPY